MITETDFEKLYKWATGNHEGFTCPFCKREVPAWEKHVVHLTNYDTYAFCEKPPETARQVVKERTWQL